MAKLMMYLFFGIRRVFNHFNRAYGEKWDKDLNFLLDNGKVVSVQKHHVTFKLGKVYHTIWTSQDHRQDWFSYGQHYSVTKGYTGPDEEAYYQCDGYVRSEDQRRPSFKTMLRLQKVVDDFYQSSYDVFQIEYDIT